MAKVNVSEPTINLVSSNRLKMLISLNQKVSGPVVPLPHGNTRTLSAAGGNSHARF